MLGPLAMLVVASHGGEGVKGAGGSRWWWWLARKAAGDPCKVGQKLMRSRGGEAAQAGRGESFE